MTVFLIVHFYRQGYRPAVMHHINYSLKLFICYMKIICDYETSVNSIHKLNEIDCDVFFVILISVSGNSNATIASTSNLNYSNQVLLDPNTLPKSEMNKVGQSVFYDCIDLSPTAEKQDDMKPERSDTEEESKLNLQ